ncbi:unnamed protein product, partial [Coregonus sp. 'balchen']
MTTVLISRDKLCHSLQLHLLACLLGNGVVPEQWMQRLRSDALAAYRRKHPQSPPQGEKMYAVVNFISSNNLSRVGAHGNERLWTKEYSTIYFLVKSQYGTLADKEKHMRAECFMVHDVLYYDVVECSNTLEDREDAEITPQAIMYQPCRERLYGIELPSNPSVVDGPSLDASVEHDRLEGSLMAVLCLLTYIAMQ